MAKRLILDTDIGSDIDDAYAMALILASPELDLVGVTVAHGKTDQRARLALKMLYETGNEHIPVAVGRQTPCRPGAVNQAPWAEDFETTQPIAQTAAEFIVEHVNAAPGEITIVPIGPFTNISDALKLDPSLAEKVAEIVLMGGCVGWPNGATPEIWPEHNIATDIPASQVMVSCGARMTMVPLDATMKVRLEAENRARIAERGTPLTDALVAMLALWPGETPVLHDPLAVAMAMDPTCCGVADLRLEVDDQGYTRALEGAPNMTVAVTPHVGRFLHTFMERLLGQDLRRL